MHSRHRFLRWISRVLPGTGNGCTEVTLKATQPIKPASKNKPTDRPSPAWRSFTSIDDDWSRLERKRGRLKDALLTDWWIAQAKERAQQKKPEMVAESKYEPTDYERAVLAKQAQRLKDQVCAPRMKFVEDEGGGRLAFDHPDQVIAFALLKEAFGTADDEFANGLLHYLCAALPVDENSALEFPRADDLNRAISLIAAGKPVDEFHAEIFADLAVCRITLARLLHNLRGPLRFYLPEELRRALQYYEYDPKDQIDREVKIDNRPVLEFSVRYATRLMTLSVELMDAANRHRATVTSRKMQELSAVTYVEASLGEIRHRTLNATPKKANATRARRLNGSAVTKLPQKLDSNTGRKGNGHTPTRNTGPMLESPRCGAKTRSGQACMSPAVSGKRRCRMHGGAQGSGAPRGNKNAVTHGFYTRKAKAKRQKICSLVLHSRDLIQKAKERRMHRVKQAY